MLEIATNNNSIGNPNKKYQLCFDDTTVMRIKMFCDAFYLEINHFIVRAVGWYLLVLEDDIDNQEYNLFRCYFDLSKILGKSSVEGSQEKQQKKTLIEAEFPQLISEAVEKFCEMIHWKPEEFIELQVTHEIKDIMTNIKEDNFDFLDKYMDFSEIKELFSQIYKKELL